MTIRTLRRPKTFSNHNDFLLGCLDYLSFARKYNFESKGEAFYEEVINLCERVEDYFEQSRFSWVDNQGNIIKGLKPSLSIEIGKASHNLFGDCTNLTGTISPYLQGDISGLRGEINSNLEGSVSPSLRGDISGLYGNISSLEGEISKELVGCISGISGRVSPKLTGDITKIVGKIGPRLKGNCTGLTGDVTGLTGDCTGISGRCSSRLSGDCSGLSGDCTGIVGDCTNLCGDLSLIPYELRNSSLDELYSIDGKIELMERDIEDGTACEKILEVFKKKGTIPLRTLTIWLTSSDPLEKLREDLGVELLESDRFRNLLEKLKEDFKVSSTFEGRLPGLYFTGHPTKGPYAMCITRLLIPSEIKLEVE